MKQPKVIHIRREEWNRMVDELRELKVRQEALEAHVENLNKAVSKILDKFRQPPRE